MSTADEILELLKDIKVDRFVDTAVSRCNEGMQCAYRRYLIGNVYVCDSAVPCKSATLHHLIINNAYARK